MNARGLYQHVVMWHFGQHQQGRLVPSQAFLFPIGPRQPLDLESESVKQTHTRDSTVSTVKRNQGFQNSNSAGITVINRMITSTACFYQTNSWSFCNYLACNVAARLVEPSSWHPAETPLSCEIHERLVARCLSNALLSQYLSRI